MNFHLEHAQAIPQKFYARDPREVARDLLGKILVCGRGRTLRAGRLVEVEAYLGLADPASHAYRGPTPRNQVMFGPPGHAYVYLIYGMYFCVNAVCEHEGKPGAVLFRAVEPLAGLPAMARAREVELDGSDRTLINLTAGPGRMGTALGITREKHNNKRYFDPACGLWIGDDGFVPKQVLETTRIGITSQPAASWNLRYVVAGSKFLSGPRWLNRA